MHVKCQCRIVLLMVQVRYTFQENIIRDSYQNEWRPDTNCECSEDWCPSPAGMIIFAIHLWLAEGVTRGSTCYAEWCINISGAKWSVSTSNSTGNYLILLAIANYKDCHVQFQNQSWQRLQEVSFSLFLSFKRYLFSISYLFDVFVRRQSWTLELPMFSKRQGPHIISSIV